MAESQRVRFGVFTFDSATLELAREGSPVRLQAQPAQALALLIAHAGEVVSRETLRQALWGEDTFVDFDRGLNFCIAQIRTALGDSAESPRFIRTLPKRGYQFIAPVAKPAVPVTAPPITQPAAAAETAQARTRPNVSKGLFLAAALVLIAIAGAISWRYWKTAPTSLTIAVTRFDNQTGDPAYARLADTLTDSVVGELTVAGSGRYGVIGNASILRGPREGRDLRAIGSALQAGYIVIGQVQSDGAALRILAHLIRLPDQKHLWVVRADSTPGEAERTQSGLARRIAAEFSRHLDAERARRVASSAPATR